MNKDDMIAKMRAGRFIENNGRILRAINVLHEKYVGLEGVLYALPEIDEDDLLKAVNYLQDEGYIHVRDIVSKEPVLISDASYKALEARLTAKGIRLLAGVMKDPVVLI